MGLREEIIKKVKSVRVQNYDTITMEPNTMYIRETNTTKRGVGFLTTLDVSIITDKIDSPVPDAVISEIGTSGEFGKYLVRSIFYSKETPAMQLDKYWLTHMTMSVLWEAI